jgi:hypothetical protein
MLASRRADNVADLAEQARKALDGRAELLDLARQVQTADRGWPQLPQEVRTAVDSAVARMTTRPQPALDAAGEGDQPDTP